MKIISDNYREISVPEKLNEDTVINIIAGILEDYGKYPDRDDIYNLSRELLGFTTLSNCQILFDEIEGNLIPMEIRTDEEVKGRFYGGGEYDLSGAKITQQDIVIEYFDLLAEEKYKNHITMFIIPPLPLATETRQVFWDLTLNEKRNTNLSISWPIKRYKVDKKAFLEFVKCNGINISSKTLSNYRSLSIFPEPYDITENGVIKNYYDYIWIEYLIFIERYKKSNGETWALQDIRKDNEEFFKDIPLKSKKRRRRSYVSDNNNNIKANT